jgi:p-aminobenzoyl-glutamate transporter AbgT
VRGAGGLAKWLGIAAIVVLFIVSPIVFTAGFHDQPLFDQLTSFAALFLNFYLLAAAVVVLSWFVYSYAIEPRLRYGRLRRLRAAQGRGSKNVEQI